MSAAEESWKLPEPVSVLKQLREARQRLDDAPGYVSDVPLPSLGAPFVPVFRTPMTEEQVRALAKVQNSREFRQRLEREAFHETHRVPVPVVSNPVPAPVSAVQAFRLEQERTAREAMFPFMHPWQRGYPVPVPVAPLAPGVIAGEPLVRPWFVRRFIEWSKK